MINKALSLTHHRFHRPAPPPKADSIPRPQEKVDLRDARHENDSPGGGWKKLALLGVAGLGVAAGARMLWDSGPAEPVQVSQTTVPEGNLDLQKEVGLNAIPQDWLPQGESRGYAEGPLGVATGTATRSPQKIFLDLDGRINPDITLTNLGHGRVQAYVDMPGPFDQKSEGTLTREGDHVQYRSDNGSTTASFRKTEEGTLQGTLSRSGWADWNLTYTRR